MYNRRGSYPEKPAAGSEGFLFHESGRLKAATRAAEAAFASGTGVWVKGPPGSGRESLISHIAQRIENQGWNVARVRRIPASVPCGVMGFLHRALCPPPIPPDHAEVCEAVYESLLDGLWLGQKNIVAFESPFPHSISDTDELGLLTRLGFRGRPLALLLAWGEGHAPLPGMAELELKAPDLSEMLEIAKSRFAGSPGYDHGDELLSEIAARSSGLEDFIAYVKLLPSGGPEIREALAPGLEATPSTVFPSALIDEVGKLLEAISAED